MSLFRPLLRSVYTDVVVNIERPKEKSHGDFSCPVAMLLAKKLKKQPLLIAQEIVKNSKV